MDQYVPTQRACGRCGLPATYRVALIGPEDKSAVMLARRAHYRCTDCFHAGLTPPALMTVARGDGFVVVDAAYTAALSGALCLCGLPADHRYPAEGEPRACIDETVRIARTRGALPLPVSPSDETTPMDMRGVIL